MAQSPSEKLTVTRPVKFHGFHRTRRFITVFTTARHWSQSWTRCIQSTPSHPISLISILILSSHVRLGLASGLFLPRFPTKIAYAFVSHLSHACNMSRPSHTTWFDHPNNMWSNVQFMTVLIMWRFEDKNIDDHLKCVIVSWQYVLQNFVSFEACVVFRCLSDSTTSEIVHLLITRS
jgi:hypothetical protein